MKTAVAFGVVILAATFVFSLASGFAEENIPVDNQAHGATVAISNRSPDKGRAQASVPPPAGQAASAAVGEGSFAVEKLIIGLGIAGVIVLAAFRWGSDAHQKKKNEEHTVSGSPSA
jgi:hypothetical protein